MAFKPGVMWVSFGSIRVYGEPCCVYKIQTHGIKWWNFNPYFLCLGWSRLWKYFKSFFWKRLFQVPWQELLCLKLISKLFDIVPGFLIHLSGSHVVYETEVRSKSKLDLSLTPVANLAFILGTVGDEVYHLRL